MWVIVYCSSSLYCCLLFGFVSLLCYHWIHLYVYKCLMFFSRFVSIISVFLVFVFIYQVIIYISLLLSLRQIRRGSLCCWGVVFIFVILYWCSFFLYLILICALCVVVCFYGHLLKPHLTSYCSCVCFVCSWTCTSVLPRLSHLSVSWD